MAVTYPLPRQAAYQPVQADTINKMAEAAEALQVGVFGDLTNTARPIVSILRSTAFLAAAATNYAVTFDTELLDNDGAWAAGSTGNRIVINTPGLYLFTSQARWDLNSSGVRASRIMLNGTNPATNTIASGNSRGQGDGEGNTIGITSKIARYVSGDAIYLNMYSSVQVNTRTDFGGVYLAGLWLGP